MDLLLPFGVFVILCLVGLARWYFRHKRMKAIQIAARRLGFTYVAFDTEGLISYPFQLFMTGDGRGVENILAGEWQDLPMREFDYYYYTEQSDSDGSQAKVYHRYSCALTTINAACPPLEIGREEVFSWMKGHLGMPDIEFELAAFNNAFHVKGEDRKFAYDFCDQRMMAWMLTAQSRFEFEVVGNQILVYCKRVDPADLVPVLGTLKQFYDRVPRVVRDLYPLRTDAQRAYAPPPPMSSGPTGPPPVPPRSGPMAL